MWKRRPTSERLRLRRSDNGLGISAVPTRFIDSEDIPTSVSALRLPLLSASDTVVVPLPCSVVERRPKLIDTKAPLAPTKLVQAKSSVGKLLAFRSIRVACWGLYAVSLCLTRPQFFSNKSNLSSRLFVSDENKWQRWQRNNLPFVYSTQQCNRLLGNGGEILIWGNGFSLLTRSNFYGILWNRKSGTGKFCIQ